MNALERDFAIIDAEAEVRRMMNEELKLLRVLLSISKGEWVGIQDRWLAKAIMLKNPDFAYHARGMDLFKGKGAVGS